MNTTPSVNASLTDGDLPPAWAPKGLSGRHLTMIEYHLAGFTNREIAQHLGMHEVSVGLVLRSPPAREYMAERMDDLNLEFHGKFRKVLETFDEAFSHDSVEIKMRAAEMWLKAHGRYKPAPPQESTLTAEQVVAKLLEGAKNVQVNIDNRSMPSSGDGAPPRENYSFLESAE